MDQHDWPVVPKRANGDLGACHLLSMYRSMRFRFGLDYYKEWYAIEPERQFKTAHEAIESWKPEAHETAAE